MRVDPAKGEQVVLYLGFKKLYLIRHEAMVLMSLLSGNDEMRNQKVALFLSTR